MTADAKKIILTALIAASVTTAGLLGYPAYKGYLIKKEMERAAYINEALKGKERYLEWLRATR